MIKQIIAIMLGSIAIMLSMSYAQQAIQMLIHTHDWIYELMTGIFSVGPAGSLLRGLIALLAIPLVIGAIPAAIYWLIRRNFFPYFMHIVWVVWLIQVGALIMIFKG